MEICGADLLMFCDFIKILHGCEQYRDDLLSFIKWNQAQRHLLYFLLERIQNVFLHGPYLGRLSCGSSLLRYNCLLMRETAVGLIFKFCFETFSKCTIVKTQAWCKAMGPCISSFISIVDHFCFLFFLKGSYCLD